MPAETAERVVALTLAEPPRETTHWTADAIAEVVSISASSVRRIWRSHGLQPHRIRYWLTPSDDADFEGKVEDVCGVYREAPLLAVQGERTISTDELTGVLDHLKQALRRLSRSDPTSGTRDLPSGSTFFSKSPARSNRDVLDNGPGTPMTLDNVHDVASRMGIDLRDVDIVIVTDPEEIRYLEG